MSKAPDPRQRNEWNRVKKVVLQDHQYRCQGCGWTQADWRGLDLHVHHITAVEDGGGNDTDNLTVLCNRCHSRVHTLGPVEGEYPVSIIGERPSYHFTSRYTFDLKESHVEVVQLLKENGPTRRKVILEETSVPEWKIQQVLSSLMFSKHVGRVERGVYAYISEEEHDRVQQKIEEGTDPADVRYQAYDPHDNEGPDDEP